MDLEKNHFFSGPFLQEINFISYYTKIHAFWPKIKNRTKPYTEGTLIAS